MPDDLTALEPWLAGFMARFSPGQQLMLSRRVGRIIRAVNAARVTANVDPDGSAFTPRKPKKQRPSKKTPIKARGKKGAMFKRIERARNMAVRASPERVELNFKRRVQQTAEVHHFGEVAPVDPRIPNSIRTRYAERRLLGFGPADSAAILEAVTAWADGAAMPG